MKQPGLLFVAATLAPLVSFCFLLLAGAIRAAAKPHRETGLGGSVYQLLGGDKPHRAAAYVATAAIGIAFVFSLIGFIIFVSDDGHDEHAAGAPAGAEKQTAEAEKKGEHSHATEAKHAHLDPWAGKITWLALNYPVPIEQSERTATKLELGYRIDSLSAVMFVMVTFIATLIHIFSSAYMEDELNQPVEDHQVHTSHGHFHRRGRYGRFFLFLSLFCFSMLNLVLADNLFQVFLSWELVGVCSYLLIGFYYERQSASNAANKAFITNRVGDMGFIVGLLILWTYVGTLNFQELFARVRCPERDVHAKRIAADHRNHILRANVTQAPSPGQDAKLKLDMKSGDQVLMVQGHWHAEDLRDGVIEAAPHPTIDQSGYMPYWLLALAGMGIFLGCVGKSAQFPLHVWLPDAMEGPTPVSALIHAATMVAAGVYLVGRCFPLFVPEARLVIAYTGAITLFMAATIALVMTDIKKVLAYSTVSQLGFMMLALGVGGWVAGVFHLVTHAFFKALLFLGSGSVIHGCHHEQEMTKMGGLYPKMKVTALTMLAGVLAIAGIPLFSGWYSKDAVLASALGFVYHNPHHFLLLALPLTTAGITTFYMFRMWFMTFTGKPRDHHVFDHAHESPSRMTLPLILLAVFSVCVAWGMPPYDAEASALEHLLHHSQPASVDADFAKEIDTAHQFHGLIGYIILAVVLVAISFAYLVYYRGVLDPAEAAAQFPGVYAFLQNKWYFDELYSAMLVRPSLTVAGWCKSIDLNVLDGIIHGVGRWTIKVANFSGMVDNRAVDGLVNVTGNAVFSSGMWLRNVQTGFLRSYVLFLVLAAVGLFVALSYLLSSASAGL